MKFFIDPKLFADAEGVARRAAPRFQCRFGIGPDVLNEQFPAAERDTIVAFLRAPVSMPAMPAKPQQGRSAEKAVRADDAEFPDASDAAEPFQPKPDDIVIVAALGIEGTVVAVKGTTIMVALDGVTDEFDMGELLPASKQLLAAPAADGPAAASEARQAPPNPTQALAANVMPSPPPNVPQQAADGPSAPDARQVPPNPEQSKGENP